MLFSDHKTQFFEHCITLAILSNDSLLRCLGTGSIFFARRLHGRILYYEFGQNYVSSKSLCVLFDEIKPKTVIYSVPALLTCCRSMSQHLTITLSWPIIRYRLITYFKVFIVYHLSVYIRSISHFYFLIFTSFFFIV